jgi:hypothetical protein
MQVENLFEELISGQQEKLLKLAKRIVPHVTQDDLLQPNDFPELENHPEFRYEEGVLHGIQLTLIAIRGSTGFR